jgi:acyl-CoA reductase-like NAD-dependent aldehyde dehydrogenase
MLEILSPYDRSTIENLPMQDTDDVEKALETAFRLFQGQSGWLQPHRRVQILEKAASIVETRVDELTKKAAAEGGKPYKDSKVEVLRAGKRISDTCYKPNVLKR